MDPDTAVNASTGSTPTHHEKAYDIVVNGRPKVVSSPTLSFTDVVNLAFNNDPPTGANVLFTVTYRRGEGNKPSGTLVAGESVEVKDGMIFDVSATDKS